MATRLGLDVNLILIGALNGGRNILSIIWSNNGNGLDWDVQVVGLDPSSLVQSVAGVRDAADSTLADGVEALLQWCARGITHVCEFF